MEPSQSPTKGKPPKKWFLKGKFIVPTIIGILAIIVPIVMGGNKIDSSVKGDNIDGQQQTAAGNQTKVDVQISGTGNSADVTLPSPKIEGASDIGSESFDFESDLGNVNDWSIDKDLRFSDSELRFKHNKGLPKFVISKTVFPQTNEYRVSFIPLTNAPNLILRVENSHDVRVGDGGPSEAALHSYTESQNWPEQPLDNPNTRRETRWKYPCPLPIGNVVNITMDVTALGDHRKTVAMYYEYTCSDGTRITPQDARYGPALWTFTVPAAVNKPSRFAVGINDPDNKYKPVIKNISVKILNK